VRENFQTRVSHFKEDYFLPQKEKNAISMKVRRRIATELSHSINLFPANYSIVPEGAAKEELVDSELELVLLIYL